MSAGTCEEARKWIGRFLELRSDPSTRSSTYAKLCEESGLPVQLLRRVFSREGLTDKANNLHLGLPPEKKRVLVVICLIYSRAGDPLTIRDFIVLASKLAEKADGEVCSRKCVRWSSQ